jgi:hypothetical protein
VGWLWYGTPVEPVLFIGQCTPCRFHSLVAKVQRAAGGGRHTMPSVPMLADILADILAFAAARPTAMMLATARAIRSIDFTLCGRPLPLASSMNTRLPVQQRSMGEDHGLKNVDGHVIRVLQALEES